GQESRTGVFVVPDGLAPTARHRGGSQNTRLIAPTSMPCGRECRRMGLLTCPADVYETFTRPCRRDRTVFITRQRPPAFASSATFLRAQGSPSLETVADARQPWWATLAR